jgi:hypothetical protein
MSVLTAGVFCFGLLVGFITYRTLVRSTSGTQASDLATVIGSVGGGAVTAIVKPGTNLFGWYAIALLVGFIAYGILYLKLNGLSEFAQVMGKADVMAGTTINHDNAGPGRPRA